MKIKAALTEDKTNAIVVSFDASWDDLLKNGVVNYVFRKRGPSKSNVKWIYVYIGSPIKALVGRLPVSSIRQMDIESALNFAEDGAIDRKELRKYASNYSTLYVFDVGLYEKCENPISYAELNSSYGFHPPQSFLFLSKVGHQEIDKICGFR